jgi:hypothetical protein
MKFVASGDDWLRVGDRRSVSKSKPHNLKNNVETLSVY